MQLLDNDTNNCAGLVIETSLLSMRTIRTQIRSSRPMDLSVPQFRVLGYLNRHRGASLSELAEHIGLTLPSMSKAVDGLVKRKLVARQVSPDDRRRINLSPTESGSTVFQSARGVVRDRIGELLGKLSSDELATVADAMTILRDVFATTREVETQTCQ
jgi:DNA-binding MarR family transcriptional regulator